MKWDERSSGRRRPDRVPRSLEKRIATLLFTLLLLTSILSLKPATLEAQSVGTHVVRPGETLSRIAARYGVDVKHLARYNGLTNPNLLRVGQRLRIPDTRGVRPSPPRTLWLPELASGNETGQTPCGVRFHTVRLHETLTVIASYYSLGVNQLMQANGLSGDLIFSGQKLLIPCR